MFNCQFDTSMHAYPPVCICPLVEEAEADVSPSERIPDKKEICRMDASRPCDFSFKKIEVLDMFDKKCPEDLAAQRPRAFRVGGVPRRGRENRYLTRSIWLNNNLLRNLDHLKRFVDKVLVYPNFLSWLDFSFNKLTYIDDALLEFPNLKILYFHGNYIRSMRNIAKLSRLGKLRNVTFHGNPIERNICEYRNFVVHLLPQLHNLDFITVTKSEKQSPEPAGFRRISRLI